MTNEQRKKILEYLSSDKERLDKLKDQNLLRFDEDSWLIREDKLPVNKKDGSCSSTNERLIDPLLFDWLVETLPSKDERLIDWLDDTLPSKDDPTKLKYVEPLTIDEVNWVKNPDTTTDKKGTVTINEVFGGFDTNFQFAGAVLVAVGAVTIPYTMDTDEHLGNLEKVGYKAYLNDPDFGSKLELLVGKLFKQRSRINKNDK